jgi:hypothetical protein
VSSISGGVELIYEERGIQKLYILVSTACVGKAKLTGTGI